MTWDGTGGDERGGGGIGEHTNSEIKKARVTEGSR